jgi:hypothetical protein
MLTASIMHALTLLVLDLLLHILNGVRGLHLEGDGLASEGLDKDLHASTQAQHQVECGLLLDVVVGQGAAVLQLLSGENEALLVWGNACRTADAANGLPVSTASEHAAQNQAHNKNRPALHYT